MSLLGVVHALYLQLKYWDEHGQKQNEAKVMTVKLNLFPLGLMQPNVIFYHVEAKKNREQQQKQQHLHV